jgi:hypothetical protein
MKFKYTLSANDYLTYQKFATTQSARVKRAQLRSRYVIPVLYGVLGIYCLYEFKFLAGAMLVILALVWIMFYPSYAKKKLEKHYAQHNEEQLKNMFDKPFVIYFENEHLGTSDENNDSRCKYSEIVSINEIESHVFIKLNTSQSFIINKTQIDDYKNFYNQLNLIAEQQNIPFNKMLNWKW